VTLSYRIVAKMAIQKGTHQARSLMEDRALMDFQPLCALQEDLVIYSIQVTAWDMVEAAQVGAALLRDYRSVLNSFEVVTRDYFEHELVRLEEEKSGSSQ
jgi:hypothetical protein